MLNSQNIPTKSTNRRSFLRKGAMRAVAGTALLSKEAAALDDDHHRPLNRSDIAILTFLSALEQVEADLWIQYAELGGATNQGLSPIDLQLNGNPFEPAWPLDTWQRSKFSTETCRNTSPIIPTMRSAITSF